MAVVPVVTSLENVNYIDTGARPLLSATPLCSALPPTDYTSVRAVRRSSVAAAAVSTATTTVSSAAALG
jgi:hypothetical protein